LPRTETPKKPVVPEPLPDGQAITTRIERVKLRDLKLLELNARFMRYETYTTLVQNLRRDGALTSVPFAARDWDDEDGRYLVLSGNHRVQAAIEAGIEEADVMLTDDNLSRQRQVAVQLSHNALAGEDDPATLKQLYEELDDFDWRNYAGLDDKALELIESVSIGSLSEANLSFQVVSVTCLPDELEDMRASFQAAQDLIGSKPDEVWLARFADYDRLMKALDLAGKSYKVSNVAVTLSIVLDVFNQHVTDLSDGYLEKYDEPRPGRENQWVPVETLFGKDVVPVSAAATIRRALKRMRKNGDLASEAGAWQALEHWAADYLAAPEDPDPSG
jgi:hypothetical protein